MRPRFEKDVSSYSKLTKQEIDPNKNTPEEVGRFQHVLDWQLEQAADRQGTSVEDQQEIYEIQKKKQEIMDTLKERLRCLDDPNCKIEMSEDARDASFNEKRQVFIYKNGDGKDMEATYGEIVTDMEWGVEYALDKQTTSRPMLKRYIIELAKNDLRDLLDDQIIISESEGDVAHPQRKEAYKRFKESKEAGEREHTGGFIAEGMVKNILKKLRYDMEDADFSVEEADIFQDVEQKIDFIIHKAPRRRGVNVEAEDVENIGIQFTTNTMARKTKERQVKSSKEKLKNAETSDIDDLALVIFPLSISVDLVKEWEKQGKPAGGPDKFIHRHLAKKIFEALLKNILKPERIEEIWEEYKNYYEEKS
ncbi:MAG: hypothetical protein WDZ40_02945 [Candidatus Spechtbacterales bacterium]